VRVRLDCRSCGQSSMWIVLVDREVPPELAALPRPAPVSHSPSRRVMCEHCHAELFPNPQALEAAVADQTAGSWDPHLRAGAVVVRC
jgi:hypothetical protein